MRQNRRRALTGPTGLKIHIKWSETNAKTKLLRMQNHNCKLLVGAPK